MNKFKTDQEKFWAGEFGDEYIKRNSDDAAIDINKAIFTKILKSTVDINSVIEFGANIGLNLKAIRDLYPSIELTAVEINEHAVQKLTSWGDERLTIYNESILEFIPAHSWDLVLVKTLLIHINPKYLDNVYESIYRSSHKYICIAEYYNPTPVEVEYRGYHERLYKRDFAGEILDRYENLKLIDYEFVYHRDNDNPQDDITWFLLEKI